MVWRLYSWRATNWFGSPPKIQKCIVLLNIFKFLRSFQTNMRDLKNEAAKPFCGLGIFGNPHNLRCFDFFFFNMIEIQISTRKNWFLWLHIILARYWDVTKITCVNINNNIILSYIVNDMFQRSCMIFNFICVRASKSSNSNEFLNNY